MSKHLLTTLALLLLAGCATRSIDRTRYPLPTEVIELKRWELDGRIALRNGKEGFTAGLNWVETPDSYLFELTGPLGETRARLNATPGLATLELPNEPVLSSPNTELLLADHFGWAVPVESLKFWVRGLPDANSEQVQLDPEGRLQTFESRGWQVRYLEWQQANGLTLPKRLEARNDQLQLKLSLHDWHF